MKHFFMLLFVVVAVGPVQAQIDQNKAAIEQIYEAFNTGHLDLLDAVIAPDAIEHDDVPPPLQGANTLETVKNYVRAFRAAMPDLHCDLHNLVAEGDLVGVYLTMTGTQTGNFMGLPPSGNAVAVPSYDQMRFEKGKVVEHWSVFDQGTLMHQLGAMSAFPPGAIVAVFEVPGMTAAQYDQIIGDLDAAGSGAPEGRLYHVASQAPDGWFVLDVWASEEALNQFAGTLMPLLQKVGITPPQPRVLPVHNISAQ